MKRMCILLVMVMIVLSGCAGTEDPFQVDTVVYIPVDPTQAPERTEESTQSPETPTEITLQTAAPTEAPTVPAAKSSSSKGSSGRKGSSGSKTSQASKATQPPETVPLETQPPTEAPTQPPFEPYSYRAGSLEYGVLDEINAYRAEAGVGALSMDTGLCGIAALRAAEIAVSWSHTRPDGRNYTSALSDYGYGFGFAGEHLIYATGNADAAAMVGKWMASDNSSGLLGDSCSVAGIGIYQAGGVTYLTCLLVG